LAAGLAVAVFRRAGVFADGPGEADWRGFAPPTALRPGAFVFFFRTAVFFVAVFFFTAAVRVPFGAADFFLADFALLLAVGDGRERLARAPAGRDAARLDAFLVGRAGVRVGAAALRLAMSRSFLTLTVWR
jgi:hypothetical protein